MSSRRVGFEDLGAHPRVEVTVTSGDINVLEGHSGVVVVDLDGASDAYLVEQFGDTVVVEPERGGFKRFLSTDVAVRVPAGSVVKAKTTSGDISIIPDLVELEVAVASGDVRAGVVDEARIKTASGDVSIKTVASRLDLHSASGDVRLGDMLGDVGITTASGDVTIECATGRLMLRSASGTMLVRSYQGEDIVAKSMSGDFVVGLPPKRKVDFDFQSLSGELHNRLPEGDGSPPEKTVRLRVMTVSGGVTLRGAREGRSV